MEQCKGCQALDSNNCCTNELDQDMPKDDLCPCFNCIIKVICQEECEEFLNYVGIYNPSLIFIKKG